VTGAKVFARDFRASDMPHWPTHPSHAFILRTTQADRLYQGFDLAMLDGVEAAAFPGTESLQEMPGFACTLSDQELTELANYLRKGWGGQAADVIAEQVEALR
jgi:CO/xanthine dehydrogenase Mo-binding subunit